MPRIEQLVARGARRALRRRGRVARLPRPPPRRAGGRRLHRLALLPHRHLQGALRGRRARRVLPRPARTRPRGPVRHLPPALLDEHDAVLGARAAVPLPLPQRRDQRHPGQRQLDARPRGQLRLDGRRALPPRARRGRLRLGHARQRARLLVHGGRDVRHALSMLVPPAWEGNHGAAAGGPRLLPLPRRPRRAVGRPGRPRLHRRPRRRRRPRPQRPAPAALRRLRGRPRRLLVRGRRGAARRARPRPARQARPRADDRRRPRARVRGGRRDQARASPAERPYGVWLEEGLVAGSTGAPVEPPEEDLTPRQVLHGYTREELMQFLRPIASHAHEPTYSMGDDTALAPLAGRARPLYHYFKQRFAQVTNPPIDHLRERFVMSLRTVLGSRAPLLSEGPEVAAGIELDSFFLFPDALEQFQPVRLDATFDPAEGLEAACERLADEAEAAVRAGAGMLLVADTAPGRAPIPALLADRARPPPARRHGSFARRRRSSSRRTRRARCTTSPACSATAPRPSARGSRSRRSPRWPRPTRSAATGPRPPRRSCGSSTRSRTACSRSCRRWGSPTSRATAARRSSRRSASRTRSSTARSSGRRARSAASASPSSSARSASASRRRRPRSRQLENPGYVKWRKGGEPHETNGDVVDARTRSPLRMRCGRRSRTATARSDGWELYEQFAGLVNGRQPMEPRDLLELVPAGPPGPARRGRARRGDPAPLLGRGHVPRRALGRGARDDRDRAQPARRQGELRRGRRGPGALPGRAQLQDQAGRLGPLRRHAGVRGLRGGAPDQDRPGLEARRGRPAPRPQGVERDRAAAPHDAGRRPDLAAAAPRHLLDRGPRPAHLRPAAGEPARPPSR